MTKIKDLVTVLTDNAFLLFPVDAERYELRANACVYLCRLHGLREKHICNLDEKVRDFIEETDNTITRCALAFARQFHAPEALTKADNDRAKRVMASFDRLDLQECWDNVDFADAYAVRQALWWFFVASLCEIRQPVSKLSPKDKGAST